MSQDDEKNERERESIQPPAPQLRTREQELLRKLGSTQFAAGIVFSWRYEAVTLKLADKTTYTPDFLVVLVDGSIELHEVKGTWNAPAPMAMARFAASVTPLGKTWT